MSGSVGVVIALRDQGRFLGEAIDSVLAQTSPPQEIIVVDDASSDDTADVARSRGIEPIVLPENVGPAAARNIGAAKLATEFVAFLDGDDRMTTIHHESLLTGIGDAPGVSGMTRQFFDPGREAELAARHKLAPVMHGGICGAVIMRRRAFEAAGRFPEGGVGVMHDFFGLMLRLGELPQVDDVVLERRVHGANRSIVGRSGLRNEYLASARAAILARRAAAAEDQ